MRFYGRTFLSLIFASLLFSPAASYAQENNVKPAYQGTTIEKIRNSGKIVVGVRPTSIPLSFFNKDKRPLGYGTDICLEIIEKLKERFSLPELKIDFQEVSGSNRIPLVVDGTVDMECGSTTNNAERRKLVDFAIPYYVSGVRILTKTNSGIEFLKDLRGKKIALGAGTTSIALMEKINKERAMNMELIVVPTFTDAIQSVDKGAADAFVLDDLLLFGERSKTSNPNDFVVVGEFLSIEPLAIMFRKNDKEFKDFINQQLNNFIQNGTLDFYYNKWFESPIPPNNKSLNIPQSPLLKDILRTPTDIVGN